ncbi:restriction endonuclease subunit S [Nautilia sp. PV-1]|uniref:restriction endonuclease subunit S n=1 Tax=Nautilia sp. PV-1 TaxID=2579250 RepID=UPI000FDA7913|nr:restriction endonuclease subunit S [Nautilia sp. PV-1]AZV46736.1 restriction endonuclease subunit S [Nautilia sp. PV-1]
MHKYIEKLLNGRKVEWKKIWEVTIWDKKFNNVEKFKQPKTIKYKYLLANDLKKLIVKNGNVKLLTTSKTDYWTTEELAGDYIHEGEIVAIPWGGNPIIQYYKGKFVTGDNRIATSNDTNYLNNKYLYYYLWSKINLISSFYRGSGIKHPNMASILDMDIPIPPIDVQREIVSVLDNFTELTAELTAELSLRKKQYEYYREKLLTFGDEVEWKELGKIAIIGTGSRNTNEATEDGKYPFFVRSQTPRKIDHYEFDETAIITAGDGVGVGKVFHFINGKYALHQRAYRIVVKDENILLSKFLFYFFVNNFYDYIIKTSVHASVTSLRKPMFEKFKIPIPSIEKQKEIVETLDKFDTLTNSITEGLPKEIELRQKQYEYYRNVLLDFL